MTIRLSPCQPHEGVSLMKASALGCLWRLPVNSFPTMNIMETDGRDRCHQPASSPSSRIITVIPCCRCRTSPYLWLCHLLIFLPHQKVFLLSNIIWVILRENQYCAVGLVVYLLKVGKNYTVVNKLNKLSKKN